MNIVYLNGDYLPRSEARVSVDDRGFVFGDGVYEFTPAYHGRFFRADRHRARLESSLEAIGISFEPNDWAGIHRELLDRNDLADRASSAVYFQVTRGAAPRAHPFPPPGTRPTVFACAQVFDRPDRDVWASGYAAVTVPDIRWGRVDIKTLQLLPNVLAMEAAKEKGVPEVVLVRDGVALEGAHSNLFLVFDRHIRTHPLSNRILPGISREVVLELARSLGYEVSEAPTAMDGLRGASEIFLTGSSTEIRPIVEVDGEPVGDGSVGPVTRELYEAFLHRVEEECAPPG